MSDWKSNFPKDNIYYENDNGILYCGDCLEIMQGFPKESIDLVLTDPPYGIKMSKGFQGACGFNGKTAPIQRRTYNDDWDNDRPTIECFEFILNIGKKVLIFGGNYFADILPRSTHWLFWDKLQTMPTFSDGELIWTNINRKSVKKIVYEYNGLIGKEQDRVHPTQKPVGLIVKLLFIYSSNDNIILDIFLGSGTTAVACEITNRRWIGIEISEKYCEIAKKRIAKEYNNIFRGGLK